MKTSTKVINIVVVVILIGFSIWDSIQLRNRDIAIVALTAQHTKHENQIKTLKSQIIEAKPVFEACSSELLHNRNALNTCQSELTLAKEQAQPCPGPCGLPDVRGRKSQSSA